MESGDALNSKNLMYNRDGILQSSLDNVIVVWERLILVSNVRGVEFVG